MFHMCSSCSAKHRPLPHVERDQAVDGPTGYDAHITPHGGRHSAVNGIL